MLRLVRDTRSACWHQAAIERWARTARINIGLRGEAGTSLFVEPGPVYVVEHRGPGFHPFRHEYPARIDQRTFNGERIERRAWRSTRSTAFDRALELMTAIRNAELARDLAQYRMECAEAEDEAIGGDAMRSI